MGDSLGHNTMDGNELNRILGIVLALRPQLPQSRLLPLRCRGLRSQATKDELTGSVKPMAGERIDDLTPYPLLEGIEIRWRLRTTTPRKHRHNGERG
jgi:hypothetical protein